MSKVVLSKPVNSVYLKKLKNKSVSVDLINVKPGGIIHTIGTIKIFKSSNDNNFDIYHAKPSNNIISMEDHVKIVCIIDNSNISKIKYQYRWMGQSPTNVINYIFYR